MPIEQVQYLGSPYLNTYNLRLLHHPKLSWNTNSNAPQPAQEKNSSLKDAMADLAKS